VAAGLLTVPLALALVTSAEAKPNRSGGSSTSTIATITAVQCSQGTATGVTYTVSGSTSTVDVQVRWQIWDGKILSFGSTYAVFSYPGVPTNTLVTAPAPSDYTVTSVSVIPTSGRSGGVADSEPVSCPAV
jgi:hypothetical protein